MSYILKGSLKGAFCNDCIYPVTNTSIKVYKPMDAATTTALASAAIKETFHQVPEADLKAKQKLLLGEGALNQNGEFEVVINEKGYDGGAVDIDWYCGNSPIPIGPRPKKEENLQFHITTLQPMWRSSNDQNSVASFSYVVPSKWFCKVLGLFDIWIICGHVTNCQTGQPVSGVNVFAYDVDWLQDDFLSSAYTDSNGQFLIVYPGEKFRQTILSPWLNVEWPAGPDYYFKIESSSGTVLLQEDRQTGHISGRENAGNCFCVNLCIKEGIGGGDQPWFTSAGNFSITSDIDSTGKTSHSVSGVGGTGYGFFGSVKLGGYATKKVPGAPGSVLWYRFHYSLDTVNWSPLTAAHMESTPLLLGKKQIIWNGMTAFQNVVIDISKPASPNDAIAPDNFPNPIPDQVILPDANGWIRVDQTMLDNGFLGPLFWVNTNIIAGGGDAGSTVEGSAPTPAQQKNGVIVYFRFQTTDDPLNAASPNLNTQTTPIAKLLVNNWNEVRLLKLTELFAGGGIGCTPVTTHAHVAYTVDHELIAEWSLSASSHAIPGGITGLPSGNVIRGDAAINDLATWAPLNPAFSTWPSCAYRIDLNTRRKLTTGDNDDHTKQETVIFCK